MEPAPAPHTPSSLPPRLLDDPWAPSGRLVLDGWFERQRFPAWLLALVVLISGFIAFQVIAAVAMTVLLLLEGQSLAAMADLETLLLQSTHSVLLGNTIGQVFGLALPVWLVSYLHASEKLSFLRIRAADNRLMALSVAGLAVLIPIVWWLGSVNQQLPLPEWLEQIENSQTVILEQLFRQDIGLPFLILTVALTPALCEELIFRGYLQRQFERVAGIAGSIALTGIFFGLFHLRATEVLPLALIGVYLAYITWRTGSIWPAVVVHLINNAFSITLGQYLTSQTDIDVESLESVDIPAGVLIACAAAFSGVIYLMHQVATVHLAARSGRSDAVEDGPLASP